ncbi:hypothetical protein ACFLYR_03010 [Chloroflexota bacterium]
MEISMLLTGLMGIGPALAFWIAVVIFAAVTLRRGGGRAERFLVAGAGLKIIGNLLGLPASAIRIWIVQEGYGMAYANSAVSGYGIFCNVVGMAGILCLIYAFWIKFKTRKLERGIPVANIERGIHDTSPEH